MGMRFRLILATISLGLIATASSKEAIATVGVRTVGLTAQQAPGTEPGVEFEIFPISGIDMNERGQVAFSATLTGEGISSENDSSIWSEGGGGGLVLSVQEGDLAPGTDDTVTFGHAPQLYQLDHNGQTVFTAQLNGVGVDNKNDAGIWSGGGPFGTRLVAREGNQAPGTEVGAIFSRVYSPWLSDQGRAAFAGSLKGSSNDIAFWREEGEAGSEPSLIVREGDLAPGMGVGAFFSSLYAYPAWNDRNHLAILGTAEAGGINDSNNDGLWSDGAGNGLELVVREGDPAPGAGDTRYFQSFNWHSLSNSGQIAFNAELTGPGLNEYAGRGIFRQSVSGALELVARYGDIAPGIDGNAVFDALNDFHFNGEGRLAFTGTLSGDNIARFVNETGIWSDAGGNGLRLVARTGDPAPGTDNGVAFSQFEGRPGFELNDNGQVAFAARIRGPESSINIGTGIWAEDPLGNLQLVTQTGYLLDVSEDPSPPDLRRIQHLYFYTNEALAVENGEEPSATIAFRATFTDGSSGIFLSDLAPIPIPGDFDADGDTDGADLLAWQRGESPTPHSAVDLELWKQAFALGQSAAGAAGVAVPEPSVLVLLGFVSFATVGRPNCRVR